MGLLLESLCPKVSYPHPSQCTAFLVGAGLRRQKGSRAVVPNWPIPIDQSILEPLLVNPRGLGMCARPPPQPSRSVLGREEVGARLRAPR